MGSNCKGQFKLRPLAGAGVGEQFISRPRPHIEHYRKFQIKVIFILPAKTTERVNINAPVYSTTVVLKLLLLSVISCDTRRG